VAECRERRLRRSKILLHTMNASYGGGNANLSTVTYCVLWLKERKPKSSLSLCAKFNLYYMVLLPTTGLLLLLQTTLAYKMSPSLFVRVRTQTSTLSELRLSLKPIANDLMEAGKSLALSGEDIVKMTERSTNESRFGGAISMTGAMLRNAGDSLAQAGSSSRNKFAIEIVCDSIRECATSILEASLASKSHKILVPTSRHITDVIARDLGALSIFTEELGRQILVSSPSVEFTATLTTMSETLPKIASSFLLLGEAENENLASASENMNKCAAHLTAAVGRYGRLKKILPNYFFYQIFRRSFDEG